AKRSVDVLSIATPQTVIQSQSDGERRECSRADVDQVVRTQHRGRILALLDARHGLPLAFPATTIPPRSELAVAADRTVHGVRLARLDFAVANAEAIGGARREVLDHDVSLIHQLPEDLLGLEGPDVEEQRLLAAVQVTADPSLGGVDLHNLCAELQEQPTACWSGERDTQIEYFHPLQRMGQASIDFGRRGTRRQAFELAHDRGVVGVWQVTRT